MENAPFDELLDTQGLICPEPIMMLHSLVNDLQKDRVIKMLATDPSTQRDVPKFCGFLSCTLLNEMEENGVFSYWVRKD